MQVQGDVGVTEQQFQMRVGARLGERQRFGAALSLGIAVGGQEFSSPFIDRCPSETGIVHQVQPVPPVQMFGLTESVQPTSVSICGGTRGDDVGGHLGQERAHPAGQGPGTLHPRPGTIDSIHQAGDDLFFHVNRGIGQLGVHQARAKSIKPARPHLLHQCGHPFGQFHGGRDAPSRHLETHPQTRGDQFRRL